MCLAFALLDQQCVSSQGVLEVKLCPCDSKVIENVSNHKFWIMVFEILTGLRMEASTSNIVKEGWFCYDASQPNLLRNCTTKANCTQPAW
jgi:hypothetical protein